MRKGHFLLLLISLLVGNAWAEPEKKVAVNIESDEIIYYKKPEIIIAKGQAEVINQDNKLFADKITYFKKKNLFHAVGNIIHTSIEGNQSYGDEAVLERGINKGIISNFGGRFKPNSTMSAKYAEMYDDDTFELYDLSYTLCNVCKENFFADIPNWQFDAEKANIDLKGEKILYKNAYLKFLDVPVFYTPILRTPSPGAKRKSGFLFPRFEFSSGNLGLAVKIPYYYVIAPNMDLTYSPRLTTKVGIVHEVEFRHLTKRGEYRVLTSANNAPKVNVGNNQTNSRGWIGNFKLEGDFKLNEEYIKGFLSTDSQFVKDPLKTYNTKYGYEGDQILKTDFNFRNLSHRHYFGFRPVLFQDLRSGYADETTPQAAPILDAYVKREVLGVNTYASFNAVNLVRQQGMNYLRTSGDIGVNKKINITHNLSTTLGFDSGGDFYNINSKPVKVQSNYTNDLGVYRKSTQRLRSNMFAKIRSSHLFYGLGHSVVIEPIVMPVYTPPVNDVYMLPNEDSQDPEITAANLFQVNRFKGYDKVESGTRINYGVIGSISNKYIDNINFIAGQIYRNKADNKFSSFSGLNKKFSDYVTAIDFTASKWLSFNNNLRFSEANLSLIRSENAANFNFKKFKLEMAYFYTNPILLTNPQNQYKQEFHSNFEYFFPKGWSVQFAGMTRLGAPIPSQPTRPISLSTNLVYNSECIKVIVGVTRSFIINKDTRPSTTPMIQIEIPSF